MSQLDPFTFDFVTKCIPASAPMIPQSYPQTTASGSVFTVIKPHGLQRRGSTLVEILSTKEGLSASRLVEDHGDAVKVLTDGESELAAVEYCSVFEVIEQSGSAGT